MLHVRSTLIPTYAFVLILTENLDEALGYFAIALGAHERNEHSEFDTMETMRELADNFQRHQISKKELYAKFIDYTYTKKGDLTKEEMKSCLRRRVSDHSVENRLRSLSKLAWKSFCTKHYCHNCFTTKPTAGRTSNRDSFIEQFGYKIRKSELRVSSFTESIRTAMEICEKRSKPFSYLRS